jgi:hypothetical protein
MVIINRPATTHAKVRAGARRGRLSNQRLHAAKSASVPFRVVDRSNIANPRAWECPCAFLGWPNRVAIHTRSVKSAGGMSQSM